jgi:enamine deaminase RidA (YjgF/YER057c/UK114 family)
VKRDPAESPHRTLQPAHWPDPKGYSCGIEGRGRLVVVAGQIGWDELGRLVASDLVGQMRQALRNVLTVLAEASAGPEHVVRLTWYVTDIAAYRSRQREIGAAYREVMGRHFPVMALVGVTALVEPGAVVEVEATALVPD